MTDELKTKRIELIRKKEKVEEDLARVCYEMANVEKELEEVQDKLDNPPLRTVVDPNIESIQKLVCIVRGLKKEDVEVMTWYQYVSKIESELPYGYSGYFDTKRYILNERDCDKIRIVVVGEDTYKFLWDGPDAGDYVVVFPNWPNRY